MASSSSPSPSRAPAIEDDGIPGGPGVYSTRCPPLPRLRVKESRDVVRRATLRARGIFSEEASEEPKAGDRDGDGGDRDRDGDGDDATDAPRDGRIARVEISTRTLLQTPPKLNRLGGGGGGDFSVGVGADRHLKVAHEARKLRDERKREMLRAGCKPKGVAGPDDPIVAAVAAEVPTREERQLRACEALERKRATLEGVALRATNGARRPRAAFFWFFFGFFFSSVVDAGG